MKAMDYEEKVNNIKNFGEIRSIVDLQKVQIYDAQQLIRPSSVILSSDLLTLVTQFCSKNEEFKQLFVSNIEAWNEAFVYSKD